MKEWADCYEKLIKTRTTPVSVDNMLKWALDWKIIISESEKEHMQQVAERRKLELRNRTNNMGEFLISS